MRLRAIHSPVTIRLMLLIAFPGFLAGLAYGGSGYYDISGGKIHYKGYVLTPKPLLPFDSEEKLNNEKGISTDIHQSPDERWAVISIFSAVRNHPSQSWLIDHTKKISPVELSDFRLIKNKLPIRFKTVIWHPERILELKYESHRGEIKKSLVADLTDTRKVQLVNFPVLVDISSRIYVSPFPWNRKKVYVYVKKLFSDELIAQIEIADADDPWEIQKAKLLPRGKLELIYSVRYHVYGKLYDRKRKRVVFDLKKYRRKR